MAGGSPAPRPWPGFLVSVTALLKMLSARRDDAYSTESTTQQNS